MNLDNNAVYLSRDQFNNMKLKKIGEGKEAIVYDVGNGLLYKIYKSFWERSLSAEPLYGEYDENGVRIMCWETIELTSNNMKPALLDYVDGEGVKIYSASSIIKASERQSNINNTTLPLAPIYIDNIFRGCVLKNHQYHFQLHKIWGFLPQSAQLKILKKILYNVKELCDNYIYHMDLSNRISYCSPLSHSNILLSLGLNPQIIDIDGNSARYREQKSIDFEKLCYSDLNILFLELLFDFDLDNDMEYEDINYLTDKMKKKGLPTELSNKLATNEANADELEELLNLNSKKILKK